MNNDQFIFLLDAAKDEQGWANIPGIGTRSENRFCVIYDFYKDTYMERSVRIKVPKGFGHG